MKKKMMASLLVSSAVVGASLAPLSAQATTTGNTPVQVEFGGGVLPDADAGTSTERPNPGATNSDFDLLFIPKAYNFGKLSISDDLTKPIPLRQPGYHDKLGVGDVRGTKEGWHLTAQSSSMTSGTESLQGNVYFSAITGYELGYNETNNTYGFITPTETDQATLPDRPVPKDWSASFGGDAQIIANAPVGKGQGMWGFMLKDVALNITTPANDIKAGAYTGNITWNLVAGPSI
ncbi:WxL domain-containing protein [Enterococcus faecalis]|nr:WxL domain-containing protein [Enterococcus faecalis]